MSLEKLRQEIRDVKGELRVGPPPCTCTPQDLEDAWGCCCEASPMWRIEAEGHLEDLEREYGYALEEEILQLEALGF